MSRIFVTGDTHRNLDIKKLNTTFFPTQKELTKEDYLIITGDFGMVWDGSKEDKYLRKQLNNRNFTTLFVDGNHENFDLLEQYPVEEWNGGKVRFIEDSIIHLMRGQIYDIDGVKIYTMGGGTSIDKEYRTPGKTWWPQEQPTAEERSEGIHNIIKHGFKVDYVISHTTSTRMMEEMGYIKEDTKLNGYFTFLENNLTYRHWFFGHFHDDLTIGKHTLVYNKIIEIPNGEHLEYFKLVEDAIKIFKSRSSGILDKNKVLVNISFTFQNGETVVRVIIRDLDEEIDDQIKNYYIYLNCTQDNVSNNYRERNKEVGSIYNKILASIKTCKLKKIK